MESWLVGPKEFAIKLPAVIAHFGAVAAWSLVMRLGPSVIEVVQPYGAGCRGRAARHSVNNLRSAASGAGLESGGVSFSAAA